MMKIHLQKSFKALFLCLSIVFTLPMLAENVEINGINYDLIAKLKEATVIEKSSGGYAGEIVIPDFVEHAGVTYKVTRIEGSVFYYCTNITSVTIGNNVTDIGSSAFYHCEKMSSLTIGNSVTNIGDYAFQYCSKLSTVNIPNSVTHIGNNAFQYCKGLNSITIPNSVTSIGSNAFSTCSGLTSITIPNSVTSIGSSAFSSCSGLTSITIPSSVTSIGGGAFSRCSGLISITIPNSVTSIGSSAFLHCSSLTSITIPSSVTSIGNDAFLGCSSLTSITIPNSVTSIGSSAFSSCSGLTSITIPSSVTSIGGSAFEGCSGLTSVTIPNSVTRIDYRTFYGCTGLSSIIIPNNITSIDDRAFMGCNALTSVVIGSGVLTIGYAAFSNCSELLDVYCYAEDVPSTESKIFDGSYIEYATLHVPNVSLENYRATEPWSNFGTIVDHSGEEHGCGHTYVGGFCSKCGQLNRDATEVIITDSQIFNFCVEDDMELESLQYIRTLPNQQFNSLFVPFEIPITEDLLNKYDFAYFNNMHAFDNNRDGAIDEMNMEIILIKEGILHANHPYFIRAKNEDAKNLKLDLGAATLYGTLDANRTSINTSSAYMNFELIGVYDKTSGAEGAYAINTNGEWSPIASGYTLPPFRLLLKMTERDGSPVKINAQALSRVGIRVAGDANETGITETGNKEIENKIYDLCGRRIANPQKGAIYIRNNKKIVW